MEAFTLETARLRLYPADRRQMEAVIAAESDAEMKAAYTEMLNGCLEHPGEWAWYAMWMIERKDGAHAGDLCFKGLKENGAAEIGYGIDEAFQGKGYATEAVKAACAWALAQPGVTAVEAQTEPGNAASQKVLAKCGFRATGTYGEEGPLFILKK